MSNITCGSININDKEYPFVLEKSTIKIAQGQSAFLRDFDGIEHMDSIHGITSDNRDILFINCNFNFSWLHTCNTISVQWYIISRKNNGEEYSFTTDKISFYSDAITMFYPPQMAVNDRKFEDDGVMQVTTSNWKEKLLSFSYNDLNCTFGFYHGINLKDHETNIMSIVPYFSIEFPDTVPVDDGLITYIRYVYDFFSFVNHCSNVLFNKIELSSKVENGLFDKDATVHIFQNATAYEGQKSNSVTILDFDKRHIGELFERSIALSSYQYHLLYPRKKFDRNHTDPARWLMKAVAFERVFSETYPDHKSKKKPEFDAVKKRAIEAIAQIQVDPNSNKEQKYKEKFERHVEIYDGIMEEKFNHAYNQNKKHLSQVITSIEIQHGTIPNNPGSTYMKYRDDLAHGNIRDIGNKELIIYRLMEPLIYLMVLEKTHLSDDDKTKIINKLFS